MYGHDRAQGAGLGRAEQHGPGALHEGGEHDRPEDGPVEQDQRREAADGNDPDSVGGDHQPPAVPAVRRKAGRQREQRRREESGEGDQTSLRGRVGYRQDEQRVRDRGRLCAHVREQLPELEQDEVAVSTQRNRGHAVTLADAHLHPD